MRPSAGDQAMSVPDGVAPHDPDHLVAERFEVGFQGRADEAGDSGDGNAHGVERRSDFVIS